MKHFNFILVIAITLMAFTACKKNETGNFQQPDFNRASSAGVGADTRSWPTTTATVPSTINGGTFKLTANTKWIIDGPTFVGSTGVLEIEPNTLIVGKSNSTRGTSYLVVTRGGKILADGGSASTSIVFTSDKAVNNRAPGDWGGIILLGDATTNQSNPQIEGILPGEVPTGYSINYGGSNNGHNGGIIKFVRIEFAGRDLGGGNEINGLTLGGVGTGTTLENIQVSYGQDDGFEFFGGTVNAKNLVSFGNTDDDFDFDFGYIGNIQFAVALREPSVDGVLSSDPNGIECDNDPTGNASLTPRTHPVLSNFTLLGYNSGSSKLLYGAHFRRATEFTLRNSLIAGWDESGVFINNGGGSFALENNAVQGFLDDVNITPSITNTPLQVGVSTTPESFVNLVDPFFFTDPDFRYVGAPANANYNYTGLPAFFTSVSYRGAFGSSVSSRWDDVWASYQPKTNVY